jgi:hypothetical protein
MKLLTIKTPCVGICSTGIGDDVCRGCKRYAHEVIDWNGYSYNDKAIIEGRLVSLLTRIIQNKWVISDENKLQWQIKVQQISVSTHRNLYCQAYELIKAGASQIKQLDDFGLRLMPEVRSTPLKVICEEIDHEFYTLSVAHYERYFSNFA